MEKEILLIPGTVRMGAPRTDRSTRISIETQEISPEEYAKWHAHNLEFGWFLFSPNVLSIADVPKDQAKGEFKSASQRLRAVLFLRYKQEIKNQEEITFPDFYEKETARIIESEKEKLN